MSDYSDKHNCENTLEVYSNNLLSSDSTNRLVS